MPPVSENKGVFAGSTEEKLRGVGGVEKKRAVFFLSLSGSFKTELAGVRITTFEWF